MRQNIIVYKDGYSFTFKVKCSEALPDILYSEKFISDLRRSHCEATALLEVEIERLKDELDREKTSKLEWEKECDERDETIRKLKEQIGMSKPLEKFRVSCLAGDNVYEEVVECHHVYETMEKNWKAILADGTFVAEFGNVISVVKLSE